jgi:hypothetical protein
MEGSQELESQFVERIFIEDGILRKNADCHLRFDYFAKTVFEEQID